MMIPSPHLCSPPIPAYIHAMTTLSHTPSPPSRLRLRQPRAVPGCERRSCPRPVHVSKAQPSALCVLFAGYIVDSTQLKPLCSAFLSEFDAVQIELRRQVTFPGGLACLLVVSCSMQRHVARSTQVGAPPLHSPGPSRVRLGPPRGYGGHPGRENGERRTGMKIDPRNGPELHGNKAKMGRREANNSPLCPPGL